MVENVIDPVFIRGAEEQTSRLSPYFAEALAALTHGRRVHQGEHLVDIAHQERIEKRFVCILQVAEKAVFGEGSRLIRESLLAAPDLFVKSPDVRRQETVQVKYVAFVIGEGCSLIETWRVDQVKSRKRHLAGQLTGCLL
jgi:hypothetical protein